MNYNKSPIGVFDSGVGGISVLAELTKVLPNEDFIYYGDSKNAPYGTKTTEEVIKLSEDCVISLTDMGVKAIVIACNTATSAAAKILREKYSKLPIIGIEPAVKPAAVFKENSKILVMATPMTLKREKFKNLISSYNDNQEILPLPCPGLVELIEDGKTDSLETKNFLNDLLSPYFKENIDSVVLGCTHYPFVKKLIKEVFPYEVHVFDGGAGTARETKRRLVVGGICNNPENVGKVKFLSSVEEKHKRDLSEKLFNLYKNS